jgi:hypothetical protein
MSASSVAAHVFWALFLLIGVALLVWNRRIARAQVAGILAMTKALEVRWLERFLRDGNAPGWWEPFERFTIIAVGVLFVGISITGLVVA